MEVTCGVFVIDKRERLLICHPTGMDDNIWSIPKGLPNKGESHIEAAIRELEEETGIVLKNYNGVLNYVGDATYKHKPKKLIAYSFFLPSDVCPTLNCSSYITYSNLPEVDKFEWVLIKDALNIIQPEQSELLMLIKTSYL